MPICLRKVPSHLKATKEVKNRVKKITKLSSAPIFLQNENGCRLPVHSRQQVAQEDDNMTKWASSGISTYREEAGGNSRKRRTGRVTNRKQSKENFTYI